MIGILFTARLGSSRLPRKHLIAVNELAFIEWLILRYQFIFKKEIESGEVKFIIATSTEDENKEFERISEAYDFVDVFYGAVENIPRRHLECAKHYSLDFIISVDGDDILCSPKGSHVLYEKIKENPDKQLFEVMGLPLGMNSSAYSVKYLTECLENHYQTKVENGWGRVFTNPDKIGFNIGNYSIYNRLRFTLDYQEDADFFSAVIDFFGDSIVEVSDEVLINQVVEHKFDKINESLFEVYWENYQSLKKMEE